MAMQVGSGQAGSGRRGRRRRRHAPMSEINVTPLVDVMLVLLIIFMVASTYIVKPSIEVELPKAASGGESPTEKTKPGAVARK